MYRSQWFSLCNEGWLCNFEQYLDMWATTSNQQHTPQVQVYLWSLAVQTDYAVHKCLLLLSLLTTQRSIYKAVKVCHRKVQNMESLYTVQYQKESCYSHWKLKNNSIAQEALHHNSSERQADGLRNSHILIAFKTAKIPVHPFKHSLVPIFDLLTMTFYSGRSQLKLSSTHIHW